MFSLSPDPTAPKFELYEEIAQAALSLTEGERDPVANMANIAALLSLYLADLNWAGFYRVVENELVLGPFMRKPACIRIAIGEGVCGAAVSEAKTQLVRDVHAFPGHIACDADSRSELVVPIVQDGTVVAVIDLDSPIEARFDEEDAAGIERLAQAISDRVASA